MALLLINLPPGMEHLPWYVDYDGDLYGDASAEPVYKESKPFGCVGESTDIRNFPA